MVAAGLLFMFWPVQYRWSIGRISRRLGDSGGDVERFERKMLHPPVSYLPPMLAVVGLMLVIVGLAG